MAEPAFICLGSNILPERNLPLAVERLLDLGRAARISQVYQNPAIGGPPQADFLNAAMLLEVETEPEQIRQQLRAIEADLHRVRTDDKYAPRTIDLDLTLMGQRVLSGEGWRLPDPDLLTHAHLAVPVAELAPEFPHPETHEALQAIAARLRPGADLTHRKDMTNLLRNRIVERHFASAQSRPPERRS